jgi:hypothetical protein
MMQEQRWRKQAWPKRDFTDRSLREVLLPGHNPEMWDMLSRGRWVMRLGDVLKTSLLNSRIAAVFIATVALTGCATTQSGPPIASLASIGPPPAGKARIVVMRPENGFAGWGDRALPIKVDGEPMGELLTGAYASIERPPGRHQISGEFWDHPGVSRIDVNAASGRTTYVAIKVKQKVNDVNVMAALGGLAGYAIAAAATDDGSGPFELIPMSDADAKRTIAAMR